MRNALQSYLTPVRPVFRQILSSDLLSWIHAKLSSLPLRMLQPEADLHLWKHSRTSRVTTVWHHLKY